MKQVQREKMSKPFGVPRDIRLYLLGSHIPIDVPKGCDVLVTIRLVRPNGDMELLTEGPLFKYPVETWLAKIAPETDHTF